MTPNNVPYLCGGTLFSLIIQARKPRTKARNRLNGGSDGLTDPDVMNGLVYIVTGSKESELQGSTFSKCTTQFKTCLDYGSTYIPFTEPSVISSYTNWLNKKDPDLLNRTSEFIETYIDNCRAEWLVKALIEVIEQDNDIPGDYGFDISLNFQKSKSDFNSIDTVLLPMFLTSIIGFILTNREDNKLGRETFETWHSQSGSHSPWKFVSNIGASNTKTIHVDMKLETPTIEPTSEVIPDSTVQKSSHDILFEKMSKSSMAMATVLDTAFDNMVQNMVTDSDTDTGETSSKDAENKDNGATTIIQQQTNVEQNGDKNINITNNGTMNIKL